MNQSPVLFRVALKEPTVPLYKFVGSLILFFGGAMLWLSWEHQNWFGGAFGCVFFIVGIFLVFASEGVEINFKEKKIRNYASFFSFSTGQWKAIPPLDYITIYVENLGMNSHVSSLHYTFHDQALKIALVYGNHHQIAIGRFNSKEKAFETGKYLAAQLETKLIDSTKKEPVWLIK